jgi:hypothetical protein
MRAILGAIAAYALLVGILFSPVVGQEGDAAYQAFYSSFVPQSCCWTNKCCYEIKAEEVVDLGNDEYRVVASGQVVKRKGFSPDGRFHRCSCDYVSPGNWRIWPGADTRCLFVPSMGS